MKVVWAVHAIFVDPKPKRGGDVESGGGGVARGTVDRRSIISEILLSEIGASTQKVRAPNSAPISRDFKYTRLTEASSSFTIQLFTTLLTF